jgi:hypothetical protein
MEQFDLLRIRVYDFTAAQILKPYKLHNMGN